MQAAEAEFAQRISALMDGELAAHEVSSAVELAKDGEGAAHWREYQLIGDVLRSEDLLNTRSSEDFLSRFSATLEAEPHLLVPAVAQRAQVGGLKQRVAIAGAFAGGPRIVVCDVDEAVP